MANMVAFFGVIFLVTFLSSVATYSNVPPYLKVCHQSDPHLDECIQNTIEHLRPQLAEGIPELFIPPCEPLQVPEITFEQVSGPISMQSTYKNILVQGLSRFHIRNVRADVLRDRFRIKMWFPNLYMTADYSITGKLMMMPLQGQGACSGNFTDIDATVFIRGERYIKNGKEHLRNADIMVKFNIGGSNVHLGNLFNGDQDLGTAMNKFLNENWKTVAAEIRPNMEKTIADMLRQISTRLFDVFSYDQLLPA